MNNTIIKIGTRGSKLALWQANWVKSAINAKYPNVSIKIKIIKTKGDKILDVPLAMVGGKGLFVKEIEEALLNGDVDLAVHSMKDMPAEIPNGLCIGAIPEREDPRDIFISKNGILFSNLRDGAKIGTSSLRRSVQLKCARYGINIVPLRGNLDTRINKLQTEDMDAIIVAAAGVKRLGFESKITEYLNDDAMLPAVGQGALCIEIRQNDREIQPIINALNHHQTRTVVLGERAFLNRLEGNCQIPIAAHGKIKNNEFILTGLVASIDGTKIIKETLSGNLENSEIVGKKLADVLISKGALKILESIKN